MSFNFKFHYFPRVGVGVVENETKANSAQLELGLGLSLAKMSSSYIYQKDGVVVQLEKMRWPANYNIFENIFHISRFWL